MRCFSWYFMTCKNTNRSRLDWIPLIESKTMQCTWHVVCKRNQIGKKPSF